MTYSTAQFKLGMYKRVALELFSKFLRLFMSLSGMQDPIDPQSTH